MKAGVFHRVAAMLIAPAVFFAGCSYVETQRATPQNIEKGVPYFLPKKLAKVSVLKTTGGGYDAQLVETPPVADPCHFYVAIPRRGLFGSDFIDIRTTPEGLLSSAYVSGERRNAQISDNILFDTGFYNKDGLKDLLVRQGRDASFVNDAVAACEDGCLAFQAVFDPASTGHVTCINESLKKYGMQIEVSRASDEKTPVSPDRVNGLLMRPAVLTPVCVRSVKDGRVITNLIPVAPDDTPIFNIPLKKGFFGKYTHNLEMREGVATGYFVRHTSEPAGVFQTTAEAAEDVARIAGAVIAPIAAAVDVKEPPSDSTQTSEEDAAALQKQQLEAAEGGEKTPAEEDDALSATMALIQGQPTIAPEAVAPAQLPETGVSLNAAEGAATEISDPRGQAAEPPNTTFQQEPWE